MKRLAAALLLCAASLRAEEIRIEIWRGHRSAKVESSGRTRVVTGAARFDAPVRLDGRELPGRLELFLDANGLVAVNAVDLEQYVAAVVASEMPQDWPQEALRAQAVAARTFAVAQKVAQGAGARAHLGASVIDQVYRNAAHPPPPAREAARATAGEVLTFGAAPIAAWFSASCGGKSESAEAAFNLAPSDAPYVHGGDEDGDAREWIVRIPLAEITAALRKARRMEARIEDLSVQSRTGSGRARTLEMKTASGAAPLAAVELRQLLGYARLPSLLFDVSTAGEVAVFQGRGSGHGVGLCQWGARARAQRGATWREILAHYYPGAEIRRMY